MKRFAIIIAVLLMFVLPVSMAFKKPFIKNDYWFKYITNHFEEYILKYPQQKVYLQLDRDEYETGSTIWYKAYVFDDTKKLPDIRSKNLYVELISPTKGVMMHRLLKVENGLAHGDFPVQDSIGTGLYLIRAFTNNMKNFGKDYLFSKEIRIINPNSIYYSKDFHKKAKKIKKLEDDIDLQFFPEGGNLVDNIATKLAFKAIDQYGRGVDVSGNIYSKSGKLISEFRSLHLGMGQIDFTPKKVEKYIAIIKPSGKKEMKFGLPEVIDLGYVLNVIDKGNSFLVSMQTNIKFSDDPVAKSVYLFVQNGGRIYYKEKLVFESPKIEMELEKKYFTGGVIQFTLFDGHGQPQCERLAFVHPNDYLNISTNLEVKNYGKREKLEFDLIVKNSKGEPVTADLSISVKNKTIKTGNLEKSSNIKNYFLLQSDLQGNIEDPEHYFEDKLQNKKDIELLMLTQGWRKFLWKNVMRDSIPFATYQLEKDIRITGKIAKYYFGIPVKNAEIKLTLLNQFNDVLVTKSANNGRFEFLGLDYNDTIDVLMEVRTHSGRKNVLILVDEDIPIGNDFSAIKMFYLDSLMIKRKTIYKKWVEPVEDPDKPKDFKLHNNPDQVVKFDSPNLDSYRTVMEALQGRVPGLSSGPNSSIMRGPSSIYGSNEPLYLVDGMETDFRGIQSINVHDIDHVDILKGPSSAIYGVRGSNGVIAVYTKKGFYYKRGEIRFKMLGYHKAKQFYSPKYEANKINWETSDLRKTVYWNPSIKTGKDGKAHVSFYQSDIIDQFEIVIEGMSKNGQVGEYKYNYEVKELN